MTFNIYLLSYSPLDYTKLYETIIMDKKVTRYTFGNLYIYLLSYSPLDYTKLYETIIMDKKQRGKHLDLCI